LIQARNSGRLLADFSLLGVAAVWGLTFVMVKEALEASGPLTFLALRFALAAAVLAPLLLARRGRLLTRAAAAGGLVGLFLFAGYALQTAGLQFTTASKAGFITGLSVVAVPTIGALVGHRLPAPATAAGVGLAATGLGLLSLREAAAVQVGDLLVLGCALAFALHILVLGAVAPRFDVLELTTWQIGAVAVLTTAGAALFERPTVEQVGLILPAAAFTGLFATVAAFYLQTQAQRFTTPTHTALIFSTEPVFAGLFGYLLAGERLDAQALLGCGLILAGMLLAQFAPTGASAAHEPFG
jgi:drug/metabolite transporter (DMT)-like permease